MVHHETSSGMLNPLGGIGALSKANGSVLFVDCVSSAGAETIDMEKDNIAFCSSSSSKAIGSYAGLSFVIGETVEFEKLKNLPVKTSYLKFIQILQIFKKSIANTEYTSDSFVVFFRAGTGKHLTRRCRKPPRQDKA